MSTDELEMTSRNLQT